MWLWESGVGDKNEEDESDESERCVGVAAYLVWTAVSSVVEKVTGRLTAAALSHQQREDVGPFTGFSLMPLCKHLG
ncbi:Myotubularin-related protein 13 [Dissostichus eleginoides]|uniref:Myotubularin-related protein 13 n=1 Tax=Dissostichus eleginoides TaxID=100907 RepID=A0AAD9CNE5_DISEL|nr:Myotubularin-related protein 13 [Dissostichus eleginoides]